ncbi:MAG: hypothetical protein NUK54_09460, partial [Methanothrix sp.]|nr:hypothetical protein [Methanothrix sp.]MCR3884586.1 hypothetical protein [Methanothrix sp.]
FEILPQSSNGRWRRTPPGFGDAAHRSRRRGGGGGVERGAAETAGEGQLRKEKRNADERRGEKRAVLAVR